MSLGSVIEEYAPFLSHYWYILLPVFSGGLIIWICQFGKKCNTQEQSKKKAKKDEIQDEDNHVLMDNATTPEGDNDEYSPDYMPEQDTKQVSHRYLPYSLLL